MPKVRVLSRAEEDFVKERKGDVDPMQRNPLPSLHPHERAREYTRALNATKLDKVFAKPFIGALSGHRDGINTMERHPTSVSLLLSGACDGEICVWNLRTQKAIANVPQAHDGFVRGLACLSDGSRFLSCGDDKTVKIWRMPTDADRDRAEQIEEPITTYITDYAMTAISHQRDTERFATSGPTLDVWDHQRAEPIHSFSWGADTITHVRFNQSERHIISSLGDDRNICLYDLRSETPIHKVVMKMKSNSFCWNPMEAFNFTVANEDHNCYTYDMRRLDSALKVHTDHVAAVLDLDYSPTGKEFVTGSYDRTIRIFPIQSSRSREVYHTMRMHRIFATRFSGDSKYVMSASEDTNIRLWKAQAAAPVGIQHPRARKAMEYNEKLKERYKNMPEIRKIANYRHLPKAVKVARDQQFEHRQSIKRKEDNRVKHSRGKVARKKVQKNAILGEED